MPTLRTPDTRTAPSAAKKLQAAVDALIAKPSADTLKAAREAWIAARVPYMQTEAFRFGNKIVDDWEGKVNSWPLDEGLIDYVAEGLRQREPRERILRRQYHREPDAENRRQDHRRQEDHARSCWNLCRKQAASRPTSRPAITPSSFCSGARI